MIRARYHGVDGIDLMDAVLVTRSVYSFVELSLSPVFRRKWSSIYEAVADSKPPREALMRLYIEQLPQTEQLVLAGDRTAAAQLRLVCQSLSQRPKSIVGCGIWLC
jgi:hypothetical protein